MMLLRVMRPVAAHVLSSSATGANAAPSHVHNVAGRTPAIEPKALRQGAEPVSPPPPPHPNKPMTHLPEPTEPPPQKPPQDLPPEPEPWLPPAKQPPLWPEQPFGLWPLLTCVQDAQDDAASPSQRPYLSTL